MKILSRFLFMACLCIVVMSMATQKKTKIIFFGDSITQAGVNPGGYITLMQEALQKAGKALQYDLVGAGVGGNKIYDLYLRMDDDVLAKNRTLWWCGLG